LVEEGVVVVAHAAGGVKRLAGGIGHYAAECEGAQPSGTRPDIRYIQVLYVLGLYVA
jgi:hypothetical protein